MSGYMSLLLLVMGASLIGIVGLIGLIFAEVKRTRDDQQTDAADELTTL